MKYEIVDVKSVEGTDNIYVLVHFWFNEQGYSERRVPDLINDFIFSIRNEYEVLERDALGKLITESGKKVSDKTKELEEDPFRRKLVKSDPELFIQRAIRRYAERASVRGYTGNMSSRFPLNDKGTILDRVSHLKGTHDNI